MRVFDWFARTAMLVLAALATLALIGSLASVSNSPVAGSFPGGGSEDAAGPPPAGPPAPPGDDPAPGPSAPDRADAPVDARPVAASPRGTDDGAREVARWLKALTYAVIALVAVAAAGVIALVRIGGHVARAAQR